MTRTFPYGNKTDDNLMLQQRLIKLEFMPAKDPMTGKPTDDGIFGRDTAIALGKALGATGPVTVVDQEAFNKLFPEQIPRGNILDLKIGINFLTAFVASTAGKYLITIVCTFLATKLGLDPTTGSATLQGIGVEIIGVASAIWGIYESAKSKIVINGQKVNLTNVSPADQAAAKAIVKNNL